MNLLEPWVFLRLVAGAVAVAFFLRGCAPAYRVLRRFDVGRSSEGQLALERQVELGFTFVRVATVVQVGSLVLTVLAADRLSRGVRGAMCAYGVFHANEWGFPALFATAGVALVAGVLAQLYALDARVRGLDMVPAVATATLLVAPLAVADFVLSALFLLKLDLTVVASCCSVQLDASAAGATGYAAGPRAMVTWAAPAAIAVTIAVAALVWRRPSRALAAALGAVTLGALPVAVAAVVLEVAPHAFELPQHVCPFCLLKEDVLGLGYPLFGALFLAAVWCLGVAASAILARTEKARTAFEAFARERLRLGITAWVVALALGVIPVVRFAVVSGGASLFQ